VVSNPIRSGTRACIMSSSTHVRYVTLFPASLVGPSFFSFSFSLPHLLLLADDRIDGEALLSSFSFSFSFLSTTID
jgi:hypothetical protein